MKYCFICIPASGHLYLEHNYLAVAWSRQRLGLRQYFHWTMTLISSFLHSIYQTLLLWSTTNLTLTAWLWSLGGATTVYLRVWQVKTALEFCHVFHEDSLRELVFKLSYSTT
jgi:hypothetical protein